LLLVSVFWRRMQLWVSHFVLIVSFDLLNQWAAFCHVFWPSFLTVGSSFLFVHHSSHCPEEQRLGAFQRSLHPHMQYDASVFCWCHDRRLSLTSSSCSVFCVSLGHQSLCIVEAA
jgi:hypothetical protein